MTSVLPSGFAETLLAEAGDAVIYADADGAIRFWNKGAERMFGFSAAEALGRSLDLIIPENLRARHWEGFRRTTATGESRYGAGDLLAVPALTKAGRRISVEFTIVPFRDLAGRIAGIGAILRDVTKRFEEMKALRQQASAGKTP
jgi:PAS domain S-box-containing protein